MKAPMCPIHKKEMRVVKNARTVTWAYCPEIIEQRGRPYRYCPWRWHARRGRFYIVGDRSPLI
jgi:hypothetical protein